MAFSDLTPGSVPDHLNVVVEVPKGSQNKYEFDKDIGMVRLDRVLFSPLHYPGDYGFVPKTLWPDGDPLDALVLVTNPTFPGVVIDARPIGVLNMVDNGDSDVKILCVPVNDVRFKNLKDIEGLDEHFLEEIAHFFTVYKELEGKKVEVGGWEGAAAAKKAILQAVEAYKNA